MKQIYFTAGPAQTYPTIPQHIQSAIEKNVLSISHRGAFFQDMFEDTRKSLKQLLNIPDQHYIYFLSSATEAWERIMQNCVEKEAFCFVNGAFSERFAWVGEQLGKKVTRHVVEYGEGLRYEELSIPESTELICFTHNESSTGVALSMEEICKCKKDFPNALIALDVVSSIPYVDIDYTLVDIVYFSVQKGFGLPAGLGVIIIHPNAMEKAKRLSSQGFSIGSYHSFIELEVFAQKKQTPETPNVLNIYLFQQVIHDMLQKGIQVIRKETDEKAHLLYEFFTNKAGYSLSVKDMKDRSQTVVVAEVDGGSKSLIERLKKEGFVIGSGYGNMKETHIRISNFPAHSIADVMLLLKKLT